LVLLGYAELEREALRQLTGVGDATLGEWREWTGRAFHVRRRISTAEQRRSRLVVEDVRRTPEAARRAAALGDLLRFVPRGVFADEVGDPG
jgi:hypothetical protein